MSLPNPERLDGLLVAVQLCVNLNNFVNIELHSQGWYAVRVRALAEKGVTHAVPFGVVENDLADKPAEPRLGWQLEDGTSYRSRTFRIRYCLEEVILGEALHFYIYCRPEDFHQLTCTLEFELLFQITDINKPADIPRTLTLKPVARELVHIQRFAQGIHEYLPLTFDAEHLGLCNTTVHAAVCGFTTASQVEKQLRASRLAAMAWQQRQGRVLHMYRSSQEVLLPLWSLEPAGSKEASPEADNGSFTANSSSTTPSTPVGMINGSFLAPEEPSGRGVSALYSSPPMTPRAMSQAPVGSGSPSLRSFNSGTAPSASGMARSWSSTDVPAKPLSPPVVNAVCGISWLSRGASSADLATPAPRMPSVCVPELLSRYLQPHASTSPSPLPATDSFDRSALHAMYDSFVGGASRTAVLLEAFLNQLPGQCFTPHTLDSLRTTLAKAPGDDKPQASPAAVPGSTAGLVTPDSRVGSVRWGGAPLGSSEDTKPAGALWGGPLRLAPLALTATAGRGAGADASAEPASSSTSPETFEAFMASLPSDSGVDQAIAALEEAWQAVTARMQRSWAVLQWLLKSRMSREMVRCLKLQWEGRLHQEALPWVVLTTDPHRITDPRIQMETADPNRAGIEILDVPAFRTSLQTGGAGPPPRIHKGAIWDKPHRNPVLFVDASLAGPHPPQPPPVPAVPPPRGQAHVETWAAVFVHGFQGAATDLCLVKAHMVMAYPKLETLSSKSNESSTHDGIQVMGERLAKEVAEFLAPLASSTRRPLTRIMFVGHSIGNLIIRAALMRPELEKYHAQLWLYISISGPHLGSLYSSNRALDLGMSVIKMCRSSACLAQLTCSDAGAMEDTLLYKLAMHSGLKLFKNVLILTSPQDKYVPYQSARIGLNSVALRDGKRGKAYAEMQAALTAGLGSPGGPRLFRIDVDFSLAKAAYSLSSWIGRTAHIEFIESDLYVHFIMWAVLRKYNLIPYQPCAWV